MHYIWLNLETFDLFIDTRIHPNCAEVFSSEYQYMVEKKFERISEALSKRRASFLLNYKEKGETDELS